MKTKRRRPSFQERTLAALEWAHFSAVKDAYDIDIVPFDCIDEMPEEWATDVRLTDLPTNGWVN